VCLSVLVCRCVCVSGGVSRCKFDAVQLCSHPVTVRLDSTTLTVSPRDVSASLTGAGLTGTHRHSTSLLFVAHHDDAAAADEVRLLIRAAAAALRVSADISDVISACTRLKVRLNHSRT